MKREFLLNRADSVSGVTRGGVECRPTAGILPAVGTQKRERQKANRQKKLEELHRVEKKNNVKNRAIFFSAIAVLFLGSLFLWSVLSGDDETSGLETSQSTGPADDAVTSDDAGTSEAASTSETAEAGGDAADAMEPIPADCPPAEGAPQALQFQSAPEMCIDVTKTYTALVSTTMGDFTVALDAERAPLTVNNFVFLARYHYYDGVAFHRIIPGFVIQGGDPVGDPPGIGGPGYSFDDELPEEGAYELGSLAMANSGADTNGSQFFVITGDQGVNLPAQYSLFGQVTDGLDVALAIQDVETDANDAPVEPVIIESITITES